MALLLPEQQGLSQLLSRAGHFAVNRICLRPSRAMLLPSPTHRQRPSRLFTTYYPRCADLLVTVPQMAESITEGTLASLLKKLGDWIEADEELAAIETDKIDVSVNAPEAGVLAEIFVQEGDVVVVGQKIARLETGSQGGSNAHETPESPSEPRKGEKTSSLLGQAAEPRAVASTQNTPSATTPSAAPETKRPVEEQPAQTPSSPPSPFPSGHPPRTERVEKMTRIRKTIAARLKQSQNQCASLTTLQRVDMSALMAWRANHKEVVAEAHGVRLGYMGAFAKATTLAAQRVAVVNAAINMESEQITFRDYVDISIAVSTPKGLVTPVIRNCESMGIIDIEREVAALALKARESKLTMADLEGGNFSISNPGIFGSMFGTPLINYPQAAVFNMNSIKDDVVVVDSKIEIRPMMYITLTYDHRLIDGREAVIFLNTVKGYIEDPSRMLLA